MGIREDAGELLLFAYKKYIEKHLEELTNLENFQKESGWERVRILNALEYLKDKNLVHVNKFMGGGFIIFKVYPEGIDLVEDKQKFKNTFGFEINLGLFKFSWKGARKD